MNEKQVAAQLVIAKLQTARKQLVKKLKQDEANMGIPFVSMYDVDYFNENEINDAYGVGEFGETVRARLIEELEQKRELNKLGTKPTELAMDIIDDLIFDIRDYYLGGDDGDARV